MNREEYLTGLMEQVRTVGLDPGFSNQRSQLRSKALLRTLSPSAIASIGYRYDTDRLVRNATFVFQSALRLFVEGIDPSPLRDSMVSAAEVFEYLASLDEGTKSETAAMLAAGLYQLAGFQANALCLSRSVTPPDLTDGQLPSASTLLSRWVNLGFRRRFVQLRAETALVQRVLTDSKSIVATIPDGSDAHVDHSLALYESERALSIFHEFLQFVLQGRDTRDAISADIAALLEVLQNTGQANDYLLAKLLQTLYVTLEPNSTWTILQDRIAHDQTWRRYAGLLARGFATNMIEARGSVELWQSQKTAIASGFLSTAASFVIRMPTSAGKTRIAELAILNALTHKAQRRAIYIAPYLALVSEIESNLQDVFGGLGFQVSTLVGSFELDDLDGYLIQITDVLVATPEKLVALTRVRPDYFKDVGTIIVDEGHVLDDFERGARTELLLSTLRDLTPDDAQTVFISAVVPVENAALLAEWLCNDRSALVTTDWRPTRQRLAVMTWERTTGRIEFPGEAPLAGTQAPFVPRVIARTSYRDYTAKLRKEKTTEFPNPTNKSEIAAALAIAYGQLGPVLIFTTNPVWAESCGKAVATALRLHKQTDSEQIPSAFRFAAERAASSASVEASDSWLGVDSLISRLLRDGIGVHHGGLPEAVRRAVERDFRAGVLPVLVATNTLAQGVNLPIKTVVVHAAIRYRQGDQPNESGESEAITQREFWNICGRAGRAGAETEGQIVFVAINDRDRRVFDEFAQQDYEPVTGRLFEILKELAESRLSQDAFSSQLDSEIIAMMVEETPNLDSIGERLSQSFVSVQAREQSIPMAPLIHAARTTAETTMGLVADAEHRRVFARTGLSVASCLQLYAAIDQDSARFQRVLSSADVGLDEAITMLYEVVGSIAEMQPRYAVEVDQQQLLLDWVRQTPINDLKSEHCQSEAEEQRLIRFIGDYYGYRLPWGLAGALQISQLVVGDLDLSEQARWVPSMVKFGVSSPRTCWAMALGAPTRELAAALSSAFLQDVEGRSFVDFVRWFAVLTEEDFAYRFGATEHQASALNRKARTLTRAARENAQVDGNAGRVVARVHGMQYEGREAFARELRAGDGLELRREYENQYDPNAVMLLARGNMVGYIERSVAAEIAPLMDSGVEVNAIVADVLHREHLAVSAEFFLGR